MNLEAVAWRRETPEGDFVDEAALASRRRKIRAAIIIAGIIIVLVVAFMVFGGKKDGAAAGEAQKAGGESIPNVSVVIPGRQTVERAVSATGTIAARRDMPVGVAGEGGMVARVLVEAGDWVRAGQTLAVIERSVQTEESKQLAASIDVARADAALAQEELERGRKLVSRGFISKADIQRLTATRDAANARVRVAQAQLGQSRARIGRLDIRAPASGLVLQRNVEAGQVVGAGTGGLFRIADGGQMELLAQLSEADLATVHVGSRALVTPVGTTQTFNGSVWQVSPVISEQNRQGVARVALGYNTALRPGGFASVQIISGSQEAPVLPESAILSDEKGSYVYIVGRGNKVERRAVKTGPVTEKGIAIVNGLAGNERVVLRAGGFLNPGEVVKPQRQTPQPS